MPDEPKWVEPEQPVTPGKSRWPDPDYGPQPGDEIEALAIIEPPAPDVAHILKAYDMGDHVVVKINEYGQTDTVNYTLLESDPYGLAPGLRAQLARMLDAGEIALEPPPPELVG